MRLQASRYPGSRESCDGLCLPGHPADRRHPLSMNRCPLRHHNRSHSYRIKLPKKLLSAILLKDWSSSLFGAISHNMSQTTQRVQVKEETPNQKQKLKKLCSQSVRCRRNVRLPATYPENCEPAAGGERVKIGGMLAF